MLSRDIVESAYSLKNQIHGLSRYAVPVSETPVSDLVAASISTKTWATNKDQTVFPTDQLITDSRTPDSTGEVEHDVLMARAVEIVSDQISGNLTLTRNVVLPTVKEVLAEYHRAMDELAVDARSPLTIIPNIYHDLWSSSYLYGIVERFENVPLAERVFRITLPRMTGAELLPMMKTGIDAFDAEIEDWLMDQPPGRLVEVYNDVFVNHQVKLGKVTTNEHTLEGTSFTRNDMVMAHLICMNFEQHMPDGITASLADLRLELAKMREQSGRAIAGELLRRERDRKSKRLMFAIRSYDWTYTATGRRTIHVNNDVYQDFLAAGGTPESIYGAVLVGDTVAVDTLLQKRDTYEKTWSRHLALHTQTVSANIYKAQREAVILAMSRYLKTVKPEDLLQDMPAIHQRVKTKVDALQPVDFKDEVNVIQCVVCYALYAHTNAGMVLDAMQTAELENPSFNARECALFATIDLMARWLASQITLKNG